MRMNGRAEAVEIKDQEQYIVIHPLDDAPEEKVDCSALGPMKLTRTVRLSLLGLRAYLVVMAGLLGYQVLGMAGVIGR